jgi:hypothetical protein
LRRDNGAENASNYHFRESKIANRESQRKLMIRDSQFTIF